MQKEIFKYIYFLKSQTTNKSFTVETNDANIDSVRNELESILNLELEHYLTFVN